MIIYKTTFPNGKIYIGQDRNNNPNYFGSGTKCLDAIKSFGKDNLIKKTLRECKNQKELDRWEFIYIKKFNSTNPEIGYNILPGTANKFGAGSPMLIAEVRKKVSKVLNSRKFKDKKEWKKNISKSQKQRFKQNPNLKPKGKKNGMFGKKHSEEQKELISIKTKKALSNSKVREKMSKSTVEMWKRLKETGKVEDIIERRSKKKQKIVLQLDLETEEILNEFSGAVDVENKLGFCRMNVGKCCRDNKKELKYQRYGYKWIFKNDRRTSK